MAEYKRKNLLLSTGKQIKLYGTCIGISKTLEIAEGFVPNIFSCMDIPGDKSQPVLNPNKLSAAELHEIADYNIRLWLDLKESIRKHGADSSKVFNAETKEKSPVSVSGNTSDHKPEGNAK